MMKGHFDLAKINGMLCIRARKSVSQPWNPASCRAGKDSFQRGLQVGRDVRKTGGWKEWMRYRTV